MNMEECIIIHAKMMRHLWKIDANMLRCTMQKIKRKCWNTKRKSEQNINKRKRKEKNIIIILNNIIKKIELNY